MSQNPFLNPVEPSTQSKPYEILKNPFAKLAGICVIGLTLLIPLSMISDLTRSRIATAEEAKRSIVTGWGAMDPVIHTPFLELAIEETWTEKVITQKKEKKATAKEDSNAGPSPAASNQVTNTIRRSSSKKAYLFPKELNINANAEVLPRTRGIYTANTYQAKIHYRGVFVHQKPLSFWADKEGSEVRINLEKSRIILPFSSRKILKGNPLLKISDTELPNEIIGSENIYSFSEKSIIMVATLDSMSRGVSLKDGFEFNLTTDLLGSESMEFAPQGQTTTINLISNWNTPSFSGELPLNYKIESNGMKSTWSTNSLSSGYQTEFPNPSYGNVFRGSEDRPTIKFFETVTVHQMIERLLKFAFIFLIVTFGTFYLFEIKGKVPLNLVQYSLVGFANVVFFLLALAMSEHITFLFSYMLASLATTLLITLYARALLGIVQSWLVSISLGIQFLIGYGLLTEGNYSLLWGSLFVFGLTAIAMRSTTHLHRPTKTDVPIPTTATAV